MHRLLASAQKLGDPGVAVGRQTYPDYSSIAAPAHENVEKDRVHLMVSLCISLMPERFPDLQDIEVFTSDEFMSL